MPNEKHSIAWDDLHTLGTSHSNDGNTELACLFLWDKGQNYLGGLSVLLKLPWSMRGKMTAKGPPLPSCSSMN